MIYKKVAVCQAFIGLLAFAVATPADAFERIRIRAGGKVADTITIDETSVPPMITVSEGVTIKGAPGSVLPLGNGQYEILVAGNAAYHIKTRNGSDSVTVFDGPGASSYWIGVGADDDTVLVHDGPGDDEYKIEGKGGYDEYDVFDDSGSGEDSYYVKGASGGDLINITDGGDNDVYKVKASKDATLNFTDTLGDVDYIKTKGVQVNP